MVSKFKVWNAVEKKWSESDWLLNAQGKLFRLDHDRSLISFEPERGINGLTVCRNAGRKDKNNVEIYERSIVRVVVECLYGEHTFVGAVFYRDSESCWEVVADSFSVGFPALLEDWDVEVIGNTFENPKLSEK